jgi:tetratricopeptide (TPR) repeat protein
MFNPFKSIYRSVAVLFVATCVTLSVSAAPADNAPELSEKVQGGIAPLSALFEAKKWDEALASIDALIAKVDAKSFDRAFLCGLKAQILGSKGDFSGAIEPLETMLKIGDELHLFRFAHALPINEQDVLINLASLYLQEASTAKTPESQRNAYDKAHFYGKRLVEAKKPTLEGQSMWARILYSEATLDPNKVDLTLMKQAADEAQKALHLIIKPREENFTLYLATLQQLGDNSRSAELLELLVKLFPNSKNYWPLLFNTYLALQSTGDKSADISPVVALERAQAAGQMVTNKDNFMLAGLYYNIQQYEFAAELLEKGLRSGKIDPEQKNWELLAACYQQMNKEARAIEVFKEAIKLFPKSASLEQQIGQVYYNNDKHEEAYKHFQAAVAKGLEKPGTTLLLISYIAMEMKNLDEALSAAEKAVKADPKSKDAANLLKVINESIVDRDNFLKSKK